MVECWEGKLNEIICVPHQAHIIVNIKKKHWFLISDLPEVTRLLYEKPRLADSKTCSFNQTTRLPVTWTANYIMCKPLASLTSCPIKLPSHSDTFSDIQPGNSAQVKALWSHGKSSEHEATQAWIQTQATGPPLSKPQYPPLRNGCDGYTSYPTELQGGLK